MTPMLPPSLIVPPLLAGIVFAGNALAADNFFTNEGQVLNTILNIAALAVLLAGFLVVARYRAALDAVRIAGDAWREERDAERSRAERVEADLHRALEERAQLQARILALEARPDLTQVIESNSRIAEAVVEQISNHDKRAELRANKTVEAIREVADILQTTQDADREAR